MAFLETNDLLSKEQHGFRSGRSCLTNLLETFVNWTKALDEGYGLMWCRLLISIRQCSTPQADREAKVIRNQWEAATVVGQLPYI